MYEMLGWERIQPSEWIFLVSQYYWSKLISRVLKTRRRLTDDCEVDDWVSRWREFKVHATPVEAFVLESEVMQGQGMSEVVWAKGCTKPPISCVRPLLSVQEVPSTYVKALIENTHQKKRKINIRTGLLAMSKPNTGGVSPENWFLDGLLVPKDQNNFVAWSWRVHVARKFHWTLLDSLDMGRQAISCWKKSYYCTSEKPLAVFVVSFHIDSAKLQRCHVNKEFDAIVGVMEAKQGWFDETPRCKVMDILLCTQ
jgi:hypothetical protein